MKNPPKTPDWLYTFLGGFSFLSDFYRNPLREIFRDFSQFFFAGSRLTSENRNFLQFLRNLRKISAKFLGSSQGGSRGVGQVGSSQGPTEPWPGCLETARKWPILTPRGRGSWGNQGEEGKPPPLGSPRPPPYPHHPNRLNESGKAKLCRYSAKIFDFCARKCAYGAFSAKNFFEIFRAKIEDFFGRSKKIEDFFVAAAVKIGDFYGSAGKNAKIFAAKKFARVIALTARFSRKFPSRENFRISEKCARAQEVFAQQLAQNCRREGFERSARVDEVIWKNLRKLIT